MRFAVLFLALAACGNREMDKRPAVRKASPTVRNAWVEVEIHKSDSGSGRGGVAPTYVIAHVLVLEGRRWDLLRISEPSVEAADAEYSLEDGGHALAATWRERKVIFLGDIPIVCPHESGFPRTRDAVLRHFAGSIVRDEWPGLASYAVAHPDVLPEFVKAAVKSLKIRDLPPGLVDRLKPLVRDSEILVAALGSEDPEARTTAAALLGRSE